MKKILIPLLIAGALLFPPAVHADFESWLDGFRWDRLAGLQFDDTDSTGASTSPAGKANIIYDDALGEVYISKDGGAYTIFGAGGQLKALEFCQLE